MCTKDKKLILKLTLNFLSKRVARKKDYFKTNRGKLLNVFYFINILYFHLISNI